MVLDNFITHIIMNNHIKKTKNRMIFKEEILKHKN